METSDYRLLLVVKAVDKITQMMGRSGNELIINRVNLLYRGDVVSVPALSANGMRHAAVREPGGLWLIDAYGLYGNLKKEALRLLTNGGNNATKSGGAESLALFVAMRQAWPLLGLMGCGLPDGPKPGSLKFSDCLLLCDESRAFAETVGGDVLELPPYLRPARTCVGKWTHYRHDPVERRPDLLADTAEESAHSGMIFGGEAVAPGSLFISEIRLDGATPVELGALLWSLRLWQAKGGYVGGMSARGNGRTESMLYFDGEADLDQVAQDYAEYALSVREEAIAWLQDVFRKEDKPKKGKKPKQETLL